MSAPVSVESTSSAAGETQTAGGKRQWQTMIGRTEKTGTEQKTDINSRKQRHIALARLLTFKYWIHEVSDIVWILS